MSGTKLSADLTITPPADYEVSVNGTNWYNNAAPLVIARTGDSIASTTIRVRLNATTAGTKSGTITHTGSGAPAVQVAVTGKATNPAVITPNGSLHSFSQTIGKPSDVQTYTIKVVDLVAAITFTPPAGFEVSVDTGKTWYNNTSVLSLSPGTGTTMERMITVRLNADAAGTYDGNIVMATMGAPAVQVPVTGTAFSMYTLSPNPAHDQLIIYHPKLYTLATIKVYNLKGHIMGNVRTKELTNYTSINISAFPAGMYFVEYRRLKERILLKFIKQ